MEATAPRTPAFCRRCGAVAQLSWKIMRLTWVGACCTFHPKGWEPYEVGWCLGCWEPEPEPDELGPKLQELGVDLFPGWAEAAERALHGEGMLQ